MSETTKKTTTHRDLMGAAGFTALAGIAAAVIAKPEGVLPARTLSNSNGRELRLAYRSR